MSARVVLVAFSLSMGACRSQPSSSESVRFEGETMGTTYVVQVAEALEQSERIRISIAVREILDEIDEEMSTYKPGSELSRFNALGANEAFPLSPHMYNVFEEALRVSGLTNGAFDVTVAPLVRLWGFGAGASSPGALPSDVAVDAVLGRTGYEHLKLSDDPPSLTKTVEGLECDLSGVAKGYAVDRVAEALAATGAQSFMVEVGGEVRTSGKNSAGDAWRIGIEEPVSGRRVLQRVVSLSGLSMATSGDYRNFYEVGGTLYSHLIDPRAGRPVAHQLASVTVIDHTCMRADALASGLLVLGPEEGYELAVEQDLAVLFLVRNEEGDIEELPSPSFAGLFEGMATIEP